MYSTDKTFAEWLLSKKTCCVVLKSRKVHKALKVPLLSFLHRLLRSSGFASTANATPCLPDSSAHDRGWSSWHACSIHPPHSVQQQPSPSSSNSSLETPTEAKCSADYTDWQIKHHTNIFSKACGQPNLFGILVTVFFYFSHYFPTYFPETWR